MNDANRFRFRAWNKEKRVFFVWDTTMGFRGSSKLWGDIEQSTGMTDPNGTEIFEGDIIRHEEWHGGMEHKAAEQDAASRGESIDWTRLYAVVWEQAIHAGGWVMQRKHCTLTFVDGEVIGNIHENPELREQT